MTTEQTTPQPGVAQAPSIDDRLQNFITQSEQDPVDDGEEQPVAAEPPAKPVEGQAEEVTAEDLPDDPVEQPSMDAFEIVHNGQQVKLTREETIKYAQQGLDYTRKTQAVAEKERAISQRLEQLAQVEQVQPHLLQYQGQVSALEAQLAQYQNVDWVQVATNDPIGYAPARARYDVLVNAWQQARGQLQQVRGQVDQHLGNIKRATLQQEEARLSDLIPEWKDPAKKDAGKAEVFKFLTAAGADPAEVGSVNNAFAVSIAYKAMKYDQLVKSKADKVKQLRTAPPVTRPGAAQGKDAVNATKNQQLTDRLRKTGDLKDAAALLLNRL